MQVFPPVNVLEQLGLMPLSMLLTFYAYILYNASNMLSDGSSLLLVLYGPGLIGGFIIPILGAIPDGAIILISGLGSGSITEIQNNLAVGVGTLAGSTIMLITVPWALGVYLGRRDIDASGNAAVEVLDGVVHPLYTKFTWTKTGVTAFPEITFLAKTMMATASLYLTIQLPALYYGGDLEAGREERAYALFGLGCSIIAFIIYSAVQLRSNEGKEVVKQMQKSEQRQQWEHQLIEKLPAGKSMKVIFRSFDVNGDNYIDRNELRICLHALGFAADNNEVDAILSEMDTGDETGHGARDMKISFAEFQQFFSHVLANSERGISKPISNAPVYLDASSQLLYRPGEKDRWQNDCDEDTDSQSEQRSDSEIRVASMKMLLLGGMIVTLFSFPMVDTINVFASKSGCSSFYVSFLVTPLASNACEIIAALQFAAKRNSKGISLTFGTLYGAANMNNTFGLSIFLAIVALRGLPWVFTSECIVILAVTMIVGIQGWSRTVRIWQAAVVASLFPISIAAIWALKRAGLD